MDLEANDAETGTRKNFDNATRPQVWEFEIVRLNQDECLLGFCISWKRNDLIQDSPVRIGKFRPEFQIAFDSFGIKSRQYSGLEVSYLSRIVGDVIAVSISNRLPAGALVHDMTHRAMNLFHRIRTAKDEEQHARPLTIDSAGEIFQHVIANQFLGRAMTRLRFRDDGFCVALRQFWTWRKHPAAN